MNNMTPTQIIEWNRRRVGYAPDPSIEMPGADEPKHGGLASEPLTLSKEQVDYIKRHWLGHLNKRMAILHPGEEVTPVAN